MGRELFPVRLVTLAARRARVPDRAQRCLHTPFRGLSTLSVHDYDEEIPVGRNDAAEAFTFACGSTLPFTSQLDVVSPASLPVWPVYRVLGQNGIFAAVHCNTSSLPSRAEARYMYQIMMRLATLDTIFYNAQRQGRISFYLTSTGEEATQIGSAAALQPNDTVLAQYREPGVLMYRGFTLEQFANQCCSTHKDLGKGRQMPIHYGSSELHYHTVSSPLATQVPQAVGVAYGHKLEQNGRVAICYFGEGAASEGDFHAALNFAATTDAPVIFLCRNNGYAISTNAREQYRGDGVVSRAPGYGVHGIRVDGNDALAVYSAVSEARKLALQGKPVLIEAMTYRVGHHSTSDDWSRYRSSEEVDEWRQGGVEPITRYKAWLIAQGWWSVEEDLQLEDQERRDVMAALEAAEKEAPPSMESLFTDIYKDMPPRLQQQHDSLVAHMEKYPDAYPEKSW
ncbi:unnamed protein product [Chrysoparadoxa australica]